MIKVFKLFCVRNYNEDNNIILIISIYNTFNQVISIYDLLKLNFKNKEVNIF